MKDSEILHIYSDFKPLFRSFDNLSYYLFGNPVFQNSKVSGEKWLIEIIQWLDWEETKQSDVLNIQLNRTSGFCLKILFNYIIKRL